MITLGFEAQRTYGSPQGHRTTIQILLIPRDGEPFVQNAILDTGAGVSSFDKALAKRLGFDDLTTGTKTTVRAADGQQADAYIHSVRIELFGNPMTIPVAFCPAWPEGTSNLLGMAGFFEQMIAAFDHRNRTFFYLLNAGST